MPRQSFSVTIFVNDEQIEQLKAVLEDIQGEDAEETWRDWKDYGRTCAQAGFAERLAERFSWLKPASVPGSSVPVGVV
jgi:hypothetical protein